MESLYSHVESLAKSTSGGKNEAVKVDFTTWPAYFTYDVLSELCFGKAFGFSQAQGDINGLIQAGEESILPLGVVVRWPVILRWAKRLGFMGMMQVNENTPGMGEFVKVCMMNRVDGGGRRDKVALTGNSIVIH